MTLKIGKKVYNTETAQVVKTYTYSFWGDPAGYEEILYVTSDGFYFLWGKGGEASPYPTEKIKRIAKKDLDAYLASKN